MNAIPIKILHLGLGKFHRAHQAKYYQALFNKHGERFGVAAFSMQRAFARDQLRAVKNCYPIIEFAKTQSNVMWIDTICESYFIQEDRAKFLEFFCSPTIEIVSLTVTEKAYMLNLHNQDHPQSVIGFLFLGLKKRQETIRKPLTILSCDNLQRNGEKLRQAILDYATFLGEEETKNWIREQVSFPNTMVDRIVPALSLKKMKQLQKKFQIENPALVATESFCQWIIEDQFHNERPPFEKVGVQFVPHSKPFEDMKLRLLNASHSLIAYAGIAKNYRYVHEAIGDAEIKKEVMGLFAEVMPLLNVPANINLENYTQSLLERFDNPYLPHSLHEIAKDGSQKLLQRIFPSLKAAREQQLSHHYLDVTQQYWLRYCYEQNPEDPLKEKILAIKKCCADFTSFRNCFFEFFMKGDNHETS